MFSRPLHNYVTTKADVRETVVHGSNKLLHPSRRTAMHHTTQPMAENTINNRVITVRSAVTGEGLACPTKKVKGCIGSINVNVTHILTDLALKFRRLVVLSRTFLYGAAHSIFAL